MTSSFEGGVLFSVITYYQILLEPPRAQIEAMPTLPASFADAGLPLAAASFRVTAVIQAVWDVTGFPLPVSVTLTVNRSGGVTHPALASTRAVVLARVHSVVEKR